MTLALPGEDSRGLLETRGLFSKSYLTRHLRADSLFAPASESAGAHALVCRLVREHGDALRRRGEAFTCTALLEPMLDALGWRRLPQENMPGNLGTRKRPDYCLFTSDDAFAAATTAADAATLFRHCATVLEAKKWLHPLDRISSKDTIGWFPSQQIQDYLNHARDDTGRRFFSWAILANGNEWRLYTERAAVDACFIFHLVHDGQVCCEADFQLFFTLFRAAAFERGEDGACLLDHIREQSLRAQTDLETNLRKRIFGVLEDLGGAFVKCPDNHLADADLPSVYENSLIFLYRLLFILYAESRGLLPVRPSGPGANSRYLREFSLARLVDRLRDRTLYQDDAFFSLYDDLTRLFHLINGTHPRQNSALGVTRYNGGLFNPDQHARLVEWHIGDKALADILRQLVFAQPPARSGERQRQFSIDEAIDYSTLEVRQLGDIYEGLLGAHFERVGTRLELRNANGENHRSGIFYTPDWIVRFLVRETLAPLLAEINASPDVQRALNARTEESRRNNAFALAVLQLNLVDPAMGSGHFLVRATEWLAEQIMGHPTTQPMTIQIVADGEARISREEILARHKIPVSPGISQERAELAYWRRRVVEACIHGVDINPMAVELAKLSLWLTCIAADEPLNFLDHHLRQGNALLSVAPDELRQAPIPASSADDDTTFDLGDNLQNVLGEVIRDTLRIENEPSTEMELVKQKENLWKTVRSRLQPFFDLSDLWIATLDGLPVDAIAYLSTARFLVAPAALPKNDIKEAKRLMCSLDVDLKQRRSDLLPFHWQLEFPDLFFDETGRPLPAGRGGFDAVLGNPPYVSIHTAMEPANRAMRNALERRAGYLEDLYVHFTDLGFAILRDGGRFGFIVSDTFFTLASKLRMRAMLQSHALDWLGQCDPFDATVDAALFVAQKSPPTIGHRFRFVQARPLRRPDGSRTEPDKRLEQLPPAAAIPWREPATPAPAGEVRHATLAELRVHDLPLALPLAAHKRVFFEPRPGTLTLFARFNEPVKQLVDTWWERIEDSRKFADNLPALQAYHQTLRPGDITLVGLIAEGGQGMRTANNARFLAYLEATPQALELEIKAEAWTRQWQADAKIAPVFERLLREAGGDPARPLTDRAAWEAAVHGLRDAFTPAQLGFGRTALFRIAPRSLIATEADFRFAFESRKAELLAHWRAAPQLDPFWDERMEIDGEWVTHTALRKAKAVTDADFCTLCQHLQLWIARENLARSAGMRLPRTLIGLRSSEDYTDPADAPRIATIYNGLYGRAQFVPFRKGDPTGSRWLDNEPLFIDWSHKNADWFFSNSGRPESGMPVIRNAKLYMTTGVTWTAVANHVALKARFQEPCIFDADSMRLTPMAGTMPAETFVAILNSDVFSFFKMRFIQHTQKWEIGNLRQMPLVMPSKTQQKALAELATLAMSAKRHEFEGTSPANELVSRVREVGEALRSAAPGYLQPSAQGHLLETPSDCLEVIEKSVNWEAEKLYGVEGQGPFDEF
ncbi:MAG: hypothetical protein RBU24_02205 [Kiritimatiellia bacterium]|jgi:hypothetical protein|nr:hypothetical protein [Kiritimatiellia bacterium]